MALIDCSECGNQVSTEAVECPKCGCPVQVNEGNEDMSLGEGCYWFVLIGGMIIIGLGYIGYILNPENETDTDEQRIPDKIDAEVVCEDFVKKKLVAPATASFKDNKVERLNEIKFRVTGKVDSENRMGAKIRKEFICVTEHQMGNRWELENLKFN